MINHNVHCRTLTCCHCVWPVILFTETSEHARVCPGVIIARLVKDPVPDKWKWQKNRVGNADLGPVLCPAVYISLYVSLQISASVCVCACDCVLTQGVCVCVCVCVCAHTCECVCSHMWVCVCERVISKQLYFNVSPTRQGYLKMIKLCYK